MVSRNPSKERTSPMIAGYHLIWTAYGWWLPNDPRGSSSQEIRVAALQPLGDLHHGRKIIQPSRAELLRFYEQAKKVLQHELFTFTPDDFTIIADAFAKVCTARKYTCYACAVMPDHVHMLIRKHKEKAEDMIASCQAASRQAMLDSSRRAAGHPVWGG